MYLHSVSNMSSSCCFVAEAEIDNELDAFHEDLDDDEANKLLFRGAKVRKCY